MINPPTAKSPVAQSSSDLASSTTESQSSSNPSLTEIVRISVIGPNVYEVDRFATAAFAMGEKGIRFIENLKGFEGYMIDKNGIGTKTSGFETNLKKIGVKKSHIKTDYFPGFT